MNIDPSAQVRAVYPKGTKVGTSRCPAYFGNEAIVMRTRLILELRPIIRDMVRQWMEDDGDYLWP